ncbi:MAG: porin family protein [Candidatus Zixiibacteriota bacterium]
MKRTLFTFGILAVTIATCASAGARPRLGIKAGMVWADQTWEYREILGAVERDTRTGLAFGPCVDVGLTPVFGLQAEALYVQKGNQLKVPIYDQSSPVPIGTRVFEDRITYLSLLASLKVQALGGPLGFYVLGGPRVDLKLGTDSDINDSDMDRILDSYQSTVAGATVGVGLQHAFGSFGPILLEARYDLDFSEAAKHVNDENTLTIDNKSFAILVGLVF